MPWPAQRLEPQGYEKEMVGGRSDRKAGVGMSIAHWLPVVVTYISFVGGAFILFMIDASK